MSQRSGALPVSHQYMHNQERWEKYEEAFSEKALTLNMPHLMLNIFLELISVIFVDGLFS